MFRSCVLILSFDLFSILFLIFFDLVKFDLWTPLHSPVQRPIKSVVLIVLNILNKLVLQKPVVDVASRVGESVGQAFKGVSSAVLQRGGVS